MRPLICPQCGGQITDYRVGVTFATCGYCSTRFLIEENKLPPPAQVDPPEIEIPSDVRDGFIKVIGGVLAAVAVIAFIAVVASKGKKEPTYTSTLPFASRPTSTPYAPPTPTPDTAILRFGGLSDPTSIAVDTQGRIYVADNELRVQQFDESGELIKTLQVPGKGRNYDRAHVINKIGVAADGRLFVAVGGVILIYGENWSAAPRVVQVAPDFIQDLSVKADGSLLAVSDNDRVETLLFVNKNGGITRRIEAFTRTRWTLRCRP